VVPHCLQYLAEQTHLISEEVTELLQMEAIGKQCCRASRVLLKLLVLKKDGGKWPVITSKP